jgi:sulfur carrier protein ThiS
MHCESQSVDTSANLGVQGLLAIVTLLADTTAPEASGDYIPRKRYYRTVLHHVRVLFGLQQETTVSNNNDSFYVTTLLYNVLYFLL